MIGEETTTVGTRIETVHSILASGERRTVVRALAASGTPMSISTLADRIAENGEELPVQVRLYHQHLPKMCAAGVVEYDRDVGEVSLTPMGQRVDALARWTAELLNDEPSPVT